MRFYLTTAIDYCNGKPHLGTAYEKVTADVLARAMRARGRDVRFLMGNDEHAIKIEQAARERGLEPIVWCDRMETLFRDTWDALLCSYDVFIRTTEKRHHAAVQEFLIRIRDRGDIYLGSYEGWFCTGCEAFKKPEELTDGKCPEHATIDPKWLKEDNWFFRLSKYRDPLLAHFREHPEFVQPDFRRNELVAFLERGLEDVSISRRTTWGVPFPFDLEAKVYVWFDALINYATGAGFAADADEFDRWWPADLHIVGKDITRFHGIQWPAMLLAAGLPLPRRIFGHGYVNSLGGRMSKSSGTKVDPKDIAAHVSADTLRYYLCREAAYGADLEWSDERLVARANADLANALGNLLSRTTSMVHKYLGGCVAADISGSPLVAMAAAAVDRVEAAVDACALQDVASIPMELVAAANAHIDAKAPWALAKDPARMDELAYMLAETAHLTYMAGSLLVPIMPAKMGELVRRMTGVEPPKSGDWVTLRTRALPKDRPLEMGPPLFPRVDAIASEN